jgi:hypothetical protein
MEKVYLQVNFPNIISIGIVLFVWYTFGGVIASGIKNFVSTAQTAGA